MKTWPQDWEYHILNTCKLYFEDKKINFIDGKIYPINITDIFSSEGIKEENSRLQLNFGINTYKYDVNITKKTTKNNSKIFGFVFYLKKIDENIINKLGLERWFNNSNIIEDYIDYFILLEFINKFQLENPYDGITKIEKTIINDYENRKNNGENGGGNEPNPIVPPVDSCDLEPTLSSL